VRYRPLLPFLLLVGLFFMHGLQALCQGGQLSGHLLSHAASGGQGVEHPVPVAVHGAPTAVSAAPAMAVTLTLGATEEAPQDGPRGWAVSTVCVAILVGGGVLLVALLLARDRADPYDLLQRMSAQASPSWARRTRRRPRSHTRSLAILCVSRT
jgi:hypothetical protein